MNIHKMISELQAEKQRLDEAIQALERLSAGSQNKQRRGKSNLADESAESGEKQAVVPPKLSRQQT